MNDGIAEIERNKSSQKGRKGNSEGSRSSSQQTSGLKAPVSDTATSDSQEAASCSYSSIVGQREVDSKAPTVSYPPALHAESQPGSPEPRLPQVLQLSQPDCEVKEVKSFLSYKKEKATNVKAEKYPTDTFSEKKSSNRQSSLSEISPDLFKETSEKRY